MDSKGTLTIFDTPGKNCPLNILAPMKKICLQYVTWGGYLTYQNGILSNKITFFHSVKRIE